MRAGVEKSLILIVCQSLGCLGFCKMCMYCLRKQKHPCKRRKGEELWKAGERVQFGSWFWVEIESE